MVKIGCGYFMVETIIKPEVLVLMSTYNGGKYLERAAGKYQKSRRRKCPLFDKG